MPRDDFPNSLLLLYSYGVVERIRNTKTSGDVEKFKREMDDLFSSFVANYPTLIECIYSGDDDSAGKVATSLSTIRTTALRVENLVGIEQLNLQKVTVNPGLLPTLYKKFWVTKLKKMLSPRQHSDASTKEHLPQNDFIGELKKLLGRLLSEVDLMKTVVFELMPFCTYPYLLCAPSLHRMSEGTGASCRYYGQIWSLPDGETVVGLDSKKEEIIQWIINDNHSNQRPQVISIEGKAGVGKTTLAKMIYNAATFRELPGFDLLLWALAPPASSDLRGTLVDIISSSTNRSRSDLQRMEVQKLKDTLQGILAPQKYLLVLDDYREVFGRELMEILKDGLVGSTVIIVSTELVPIATRRWVPSLSKSDSWSLFARCAGFDEEREKENPSFMTRIGRSIAQNCHGCPQAIKTVGSLLLTNRDEISWRGVKARSICSPLNEQDEAAANAFNASVEQMSASLLHCLYVSSILSNSKAMPKDQLIFSWMALGLLHSRDETRDPVAIGNKYCDELASRCIVQLFQSRDGHPMVLLNQHVASLQGILGQVEFAPSGSPLSKDCQYLIWRGDENSTDQDLAQNCSTVTTFRFQNYVGRISKQFLKKLISRMKYARVLLLDGSQFAKFPVGIGTLQLLKYLSVAGNVRLKALPESICSLRNLQTLDLSGCCELQTFPQNMHELVSLRHLFLSTSLTKLPELPWASLYHLRICSSPNLSLFPEQIPPSTLKVLQIHDCPEIASLPDRLLERLSSLQEISILNCELLDLTNWRGLSVLIRLEYLQIQGLPKLRNFPEGLHSVARSLQHFVVSNCESLMSLPEDLHSCRSLVEMVIENCSNLATLPKGIHEIPILQVLKIINCPKLITRCERGVGDDWHLISHIPKIQLDHQVYQPGYLPVTPKTVQNPIAGTSSQQEAHDSSEISEIISDKVQAKTDALKSKSPSCHTKNFDCSKAVPLPYTYGVLKRICDMATSLTVEEYVKDLSDIFLGFRLMYPILYSGDAKGVGKFLDRLRTVAYDTEDLVAIYLLYQQNLPSTSPRLTTYLRNLGDCIAELRDSFRALEDEVQFQGTAMYYPIHFIFDPDEFAASSLFRGATCRYYGGIWSLPDGETIVGLDSKKEEIIQWILKDNERTKVISIEGEAGAGKTTLAKMIYNDASFQVSASFDLILWALTPPASSDLRGTLVEIISSSTNQSRSDLQRVGREWLKQEMRRILSGQKYLLVLDAHSTDEHLRPSDWAELCQILAVGLAGSTVITTACTDIAIKRFQVQRLQEEACWSLFAQSAGFKEEEEKMHPSFLTSIGKSLVGSCMGNPGKIKTLGSLLRNKRDELSWKQIEYSRVLQPKIDSLFEISAKHMSCDLLHCLYLSIYLYTCTRENVISRDKLIHCWMAMGLLHSTDKTEDPVDIGNRYCKELAARCFFQFFQSDGFPMVLLQMQDEMFDRVLPEIEFLPYEDHGLYRFRAALPPYEVRLVSENKQSVIWHEQIGEVPEVLQLESHLGKLFWRKLISRMKYARVLLLDGSEFEELPVTIGTLKLLKYLSLAGNAKIRALPDSVCSLPNLQTLDLSGCCKLQTFPQNMHELVSLRHLFLSTSLTKLPELPWASLHHLRICSSPKLFLLPEQIPASTLKVLQIHDCPQIASLPDRFLDRLFSLQEISILNCQLLDLTNWFGLRTCKRLEYIQIQGLPKLSSFPEGLHSLQHFVLGNCNSLISLPQDLQSCRTLVEMVIENCSNLATLPKGIQEMPLQVLKIINCPKLITRCKRGVGDDWHLISHIPKIQLDHQVYQPGPSEGSVVEEPADPRFIFFLLPEDYVIEKDKLIQLWMAEGWINDEQHGDRLFSSFFQNGYLSICTSNFKTGKDRYRINTQKINELCASQSCNSSYYLQWNKEYLNHSRPAESIRHASLRYNAEIDAIGIFTQLRTLLFHGNHGHEAIQIPRQLFSVFNQLVILDLSRTHMKVIPSNIEHMRCLRYLDLSWTLIEWLPSILCTLVQLQTLKLRCCYNLTVLPEKLHQLTKLRHLDVDVLGQLEIMPPKIGELLHLRTLPAFVVGTEDGRKILELNKVNNLSGKLCIANIEKVVDGDEAEAAALAYKEHLKTLELRWTSSEICGPHKNSEAILDKLKPSTKLEELHITCYEGESFPRWIGDPFYCNLVTIMLYRCENLLYIPVLEQLPNLKHLRLVRMNSVKEFINKQEQRYYAAFPNLEKLEIDEMQSLENWDWSKSHEGDFSILSHLIIEDCPNLARFDVIPHLPSIRVFEMINCPMLETLSDSKLPDSLEELTIDDCPPLEQRCVHGGDDWPKIQHIPNISITGVDEHERITVPESRTEQVSTLEGHPSSSSSID